MCYGSANWKREEVAGHKFDFVDVQDYHSETFGVRFQYFWLYVLLAKSFAVYLSDLFTATTMIASKKWSNHIFDKCLAQQLKASSCIVVDFNIGKWIFVGCIIFSYLLLAYEAYKAKKIIRSRDISFAFTNVMTNTYYSIRSYDHFCFFCQIENSTKKKDDLTFFIFFTFKGWKRLLLADGPRQMINILTLYSFMVINNYSLSEAETYFLQGDLTTKLLLGSILFTVTIFLGSLVLLIIAAIMYIPLLFYIRGNLKEYCCHKIDKRIEELLRRKSRQRVKQQQMRARLEAKGEQTEFDGAAQPTLPTLDIDDLVVSSAKDAEKIGGQQSYPLSASRDRFYDKEDLYSSRPGYPPSLNGSAPDYPPSMHAYDQNAPYLHGAQPVALSRTTTPYEDSMYDGRGASSTGHMTRSAGDPYSQHHSRSTSKATSALGRHDSTPAANPQDQRMLYRQSETQDILDAYADFGESNFQPAGAATASGRSPAPSAYTYGITQAHKRTPSTTYSVPSHPAGGKGYGSRDFGHVWPSGDDDMQLHGGLNGAGIQMQSLRQSEVGDASQYGKQWSAYGSDQKYTEPGEPRKKMSLLAHSRTRSKAERQDSRPHAV